MKSKIFTLAILILLAGCGVNEREAQVPVETGANGAEIEAPITLTLMTHDSFSVSEEVIAEFESAHNVKIVLLPSGDAGAMLNQAILAKDDPLADLLFGVDNTFMSRALEEDIFEVYESAGLSDVDKNLQLDDTDRLTPIDFGDVCLNYDRVWFEDQGLEPPKSLTDLTQPEYRRLTVVENPATSSPGLAFLLATIDVFGTTGDYNYLDYWRDLRANDVFVSDGWEDAYFGQFSATGEGERPIVVSYASSPPAEIVFAEEALEEPPTASVVQPNTCFRQIEFVGILIGTQNRQVAEAFIDFMLSVRFQEDIPLNMFVFPVNKQAKLPQVFIDWAKVPAEPATVDPEQIEQNREEWIKAWTDVVLR